MDDNGWHVIHASSLLRYLLDFRQSHQILTSYEAIELSFVLSPTSRINWDFSFIRLAFYSHAKCFFRWTPSFYHLFPFYRILPPLSILMLKVIGNSICAKQATAPRRLESKNRWFWASTEGGIMKQSGHWVSDRWWGVWEPTTTGWSANIPLLRSNVE